jgi:hypothetical protein
MLNRDASEPPTMEKVAVSPTSTSVERMVVIPLWFTRTK